MFRKIIFWAHLVTALAAGIFIFIMSFTGVMLAYESQITSWAEGLNNIEVPDNAERLSADELAQIALQQNANASSGSLVFSSDPAEPVALQVGRDSSLMLNPYTGEVIEDASASFRSFFQIMESWHRYLNNRTVGGPINDASNLMFLFLVISGIYLWFPRMMKWPILRARIFFAGNAPNSKARDFNWHHVFAFWSLIPLFLVVLSGVVMSYPWASNLVYAAFGEEAPQGRGGPPQGGPGGPGGAGMRMEGGGLQFGANAGQMPNVGNAAPVAATMPSVSLDPLLQTVQSEIGQFSSLTIPLSISGESVTLTVELMSEEERAPRQTLELSTTDARVLSVSEPQGMGVPGGGETSPGQAARMWFRFVHTGQQYGIVGQTLAGLASLAACFLVYTGFALAYRRLIQPLFRR